MSDNMFPTPAEVRQMDADRDAVIIKKCREYLREQILKSGGKGFSVYATDFPHVAREALKEELTKAKWSFKYENYPRDPCVVFTPME